MRVTRGQTRGDSYKLGTESVALYYHRISITRPSQQNPAQFRRDSRAVAFVNGGVGSLSEHVLLNVGLLSPERRVPLQQTRAVSEHS